MALGNAYQQHLQKVQKRCIGYMITKIMHISWYMLILIPISWVILLLLVSPVIVTSGKLSSINLGIVGDCTQHILWQVEHLPVPSHLKNIVIYCVTKNISKDSPSGIENSILCISLLFKKRNPCLKITITRIFPRDDKVSRFRIIPPQIN